MRRRQPKPTRCSGTTDRHTAQTSWDFLYTGIEGVAKRSTARARHPMQNIPPGRTEGGPCRRTAATARYTLERDQQRQPNAHAYQILFSNSPSTTQTRVGHLPRGCHTFSHRESSATPLRIVDTQTTQYLQTKRANTHATHSGEFTAHPLIAHTTRKGQTAK
jgi:hypothetical protein